MGIVPFLALTNMDIKISQVIADAICKIVWREAYDL